MGRFIKVIGADFSSIAAVIENRINTAVSPTGSGFVEGGGIFAKGSVIALSATANRKFKFDKWNDNSTDNPRNITVSGDTTYTANFVDNGEIDALSLTQYTGSLGTTGFYYVPNKGGMHVNIAVSPGESYTIYNDIDGTSGLFVGVLTEVCLDRGNAAGTDPVPWSSQEGFTSRIRIAANDSLTITIPNDGASLVLSVVDGAGTTIPSAYIKN